MSEEICTIGAVPYEEEEQQAGTPNYDALAARSEVYRFCSELRRMFPNPPPRTRIALYREKGGNGGYYEAAVYFSDALGSMYAMVVEQKAPRKWDEQRVEHWQEIYAHLENGGLLQRIQDRARHIENNTDVRPNFALITQHDSDLSGTPLEVAGIRILIARPPVVLEDGRFLLGYTEDTNDTSE